MDKIWQLRRRGFYERRLYRGEMHHVMAAPHEIRTWTTPVINEILRRQKGRRVPCVLKRVFDGGALPANIYDLMR